MILRHRHAITLAEALELVRAQCGAASRELALSQERP